ncbi:B3/4 domain-containing protein [Luteococcus peritonei]|uniref:B3/4 domain-containing protein n=1 Tax=Luteococcus peritonei TaxID=88874 RepID=A0ABW4RX73_9ACTN
MTDFTVDDPFFQLFPDARIGVIVCHGIDNTGESSPELLARLEAATQGVGRHLPNPEFSQNDVVQTWRKAFQKFPGKKGARSSVEAMLKRAHQGKGVGSINPLVDLYNAVSLEHAVPIGGEDLAKIVGDVRLTRAAGEEDFVTLGSEKSEPAVAGEVCYLDDEGAICRNWNWREAMRTMLTEQTTDAVMVIEAVDGSNNDDIEAAMRELEAGIQKHLGATTTSSVLTEGQARISLA